MTLVPTMLEDEYESLPSRWPRVRYSLDYLSACVLIVATSPLMLLAAILVRVSSRGPIIYRQTRLGIDGSRYTIYKFRSMYHDCEKLSGPRWSTPGDDRVTFIGKILRATHVDELPQLWNVLRGEMSLVGPRPERPEIVVGLELAIPCYRERLQVRPGVTGLAQVQLAPDTDLESVRRKLAYDLFYIQHSSVWLDSRLIVATVMKILGFPASVTTSRLDIPNKAIVEKA